MGCDVVCWYSCDNIFGCRLHFGNWYEVLQSKSEQGMSSLQRVRGGLASEVEPMWLHCPWWVSSYTRNLAGLKAGHARMVDETFILWKAGGTCQGSHSFWTSVTWGGAGVACMVHECADQYWAQSDSRMRTGCGEGWKLEVCDAVAGAEELVLDERHGGEAQVRWRTGHRSFRRHVCSWKAVQAVDTALTLFRIWCRLV